MRLRNIYLKCKEHIGEVEEFRAISVNGNNNLKHVTGWKKFSKMITEELMPIEYLSNEAEMIIKSMPEIYLAKDTFNMDTSDWNDIDRARVELINCMADAIGLYESLEIERDEENTVGIDIKLPKTDNFSDFKKYIDQLEFILYKCPFFRKKSEETLKFESLDVGSMWLNFICVGASIGTASVLLNNIAAFIDKCFIVRSHYLNLQTQKKYLEQLEKEEKTKKTVLEGLEQVYQAQVKEVIIDLQNITNIKLDDGEEYGTVEQAFQKTNELLDKGMQIYATLNASEQNQVLFKPIEMRYLEIEEKSKLLEDNKKERENEQSNNV